MKAKELMIGDWVNINESNPLYARVSYVNNWKVGLEGITDRDAEDIYPIPLTEEILKANGFFWNDNEKIYLHLGSPSKYFIIDNNLETSIGLGYIIKINHVHELQHALRLCGLVELADNFKVE